MTTHLCRCPGRVCVSSCSQLFVSAAPKLPCSLCSIVKPSCFSLFLLLCPQVFSLIRPYSKCLCPQTHINIQRISCVAQAGRDANIWQEAVSSSDPTRVVRRRTMETSVSATIVTFHRLAVVERTCCPVCVSTCLDMETVYSSYTESVLKSL